MNLKDTIRAEVRDQLKKMEVGCQNMASLLHLLGIGVGSWPNPSPQEVGRTSGLIFYIDVFTLFSTLWKMRRKTAIFQFVYMRTSNLVSCFLLNYSHFGILTPWNGP